MKTILVAVDFKRGTDQVLCVAARLAVATGARLMVLHITDARHIGHDYEKMQDVFDRSDPRWNLPAAEAGKLAVTGDTMCVVGDPAHEILAAAKKVRADLVVLGNKNHGRVFERVHPSIVPLILSAARCPVVMVPLIRGDHRFKRSAA